MQPRNVPPLNAGSRDLNLLVAGNAVSALGNAVYLIAVTLLLKSLTESAFMLGLFQFVALAPGFLLSPIAGAIVDRAPRRTVIVVSDVLRGVLMIAAGIGLLFPVLRTPWFILPVAFVSGIGHAVFVPAVLAFLPSLVPPERLHAATGLRAAVSQTANLVGNALGGVLFAVFGAPLVFVFNGITFVLSGVQERFIRTTGTIEERSQGSMLQSARSGLRWAVGKRAVRRIVLSQAGLFVISPVLLLSLPFLVIDDLNMDEATVGFFFALALAGGIVAFLVLRRFDAHRLLQRPLIAMAYVGLAAAFLAIALATTPVVIAAVALIVGAAAGVVYLYAATWIQLRTAPEMHGRVFAILEAASALAAPLSYPVAGGLLDILGPQRRWVLFLVAAAGSAAWAIRMRAMPHDEQPTSE